MDTWSYPRQAADGEGFQLRPFSLPAGERTYQFLDRLDFPAASHRRMELERFRSERDPRRVEDLYALSQRSGPLGRWSTPCPPRCGPRLAAGTVTAHGAATSITRRMAKTCISRLGQVIDMAGAAEHDDLCEAALFYLLERLRLALENPDETARVKLMVVDEAWRYLQDPAVLSYLAEAAKLGARRTRR